MENLIGKKFGQLTVLSKDETETRTRSGTRLQYWLCSCDCGKDYRANGNHLRSGHTWRCLDCSFIKSRNPKGNPNLGKIPVYCSKTPEESSFRQLFANTKSRAKREKKKFEITHDYAWKLFEDQNSMCCLSGLPISFGKGRKAHTHGDTTASIDRIDSSKGYEEGNIQWVHKRINWMKGNSTVSDFIELCDAVRKHNKIP